jgi:hypothetical protein
MAPAAIKNPVPVVAVLQPKPEEAPPEKEKQVAEREQDVHIQQKSGDYGRQPGCCNCSNILQHQAIRAKYDGQETYPEADDAARMTTNIAEPGEVRLREERRLSSYNGVREPFNAQSWMMCCRWQVP